MAGKFDTHIDTLLDEFSKLDAVGGLPLDCLDQGMSDLLDGGWAPAPESMRLTAADSDCLEPQASPSFFSTESQVSATESSFSPIERISTASSTSSQTPEVSTTEEIGPLRSRKGHKKSRAGCFTCKRRKIKCQENQPICRNCTLRNLPCSWPAPKPLTVVQNAVTYSPTPVCSFNLQGTPKQFSLADMRLFYHYLSSAYPVMPVGTETTWRSQIPLVANHNDYLMYAILAVSASHLNLLQGGEKSDLSQLALQHRIVAIHGLNKALSSKPRTGTDGDALLGACYLLLYQSWYLEDGASELFQFLRGCHVLDKQLREENLPVLFVLHRGGRHMKIMQSRLINLPVVNLDRLAAADRALADLVPFLEKPAHIQLHEMMVQCVRGAMSSSLEGYHKFIRFYQIASEFDNQEFNDFADPTNSTSRILISFLFAIQMVLLPLLGDEWPKRAKSTPLSGILLWIRTIHNSLPQELKKFTDWPMMILDLFEEEYLKKKLEPIPTK